MLVDKITKEIIELATPRQREILIELVSCRCPKRTAATLAIPLPYVYSTFKAALARAARQGYCPEQGLTTKYPDGYVMGKVTVQRGKDGEVERTWERMCAETNKQMELAKQAIQALCEDIEPYPVSDNSHVGFCDEDLMVNIPIGDAHIGMLAWGEECGANYDLKIAEGLHKQAIDMLINSTPMAASCTIIDLGDFLHADNLSGITSRGGNVMDMDARYHKVVRAAVRISNYYIQQALKKFKYVTYRPEIGNHNDVGAIWMQELLSILYANEPRVTIGNAAGGVYFWQHGLCFFGSHHGHLIKFDKLPAIMAAEVMDKHIETKYRKFYCGHVHHKSLRSSDFNTCEVQTYRTLAPKDAYASSHGYNAPRNITAETWHKRLGEISTVNVNISMLESDDA